MKKVAVKVFKEGTVNGIWELNLVRTYHIDFDEKEGDSFEIDIVNHKYCFDENGEIYLEIKKKDEIKKD